MGGERRSLLRLARVDEVLETEITSNYWIGWSNSCVLVLNWMGLKDRIVHLEVVASDF